MRREDTQFDHRAEDVENATNDIEAALGHCMYMSISSVVAKVCRDEILRSAMSEKKAPNQSMPRKIYAWLLLVIGCKLSSIWSRIWHTQLMPITRPWRL